MDDHPDQRADVDPTHDASHAGEGDEQSDARVGVGVEHLQSAARELIAAARTFLDIAEEVVGDKVAVASVADLLGSVSQVVSRATTNVQTPGGPAGDDGGDDPEPRVQHIKVT